MLRQSVANDASGRVADASRRGVVGGLALRRDAPSGRSKGATKVIKRAAARNDLTETTLVEERQRRHRPKGAGALNQGGLVSGSRQIMSAEVRSTAAHRFWRSGGGDRAGESPENGRVWWRVLPAPFGA